LSGTRSEGGIEMTTVAEQRMAPGDTSLRWGSWLIAAAGLGFVGYGVIFFIMNFTDAFLELGIGPEQVDVGRTEIEAFSPSLVHYISHLHLAVAGLLAGLGLAVAFLAYGVRRGEMWALRGAVVAPVLALAVALPAHYPFGLATIGHLGLIYLAVVIFLMGVVLAWLGMRARA
jgi:hypothetical protein